MSVISYGPNETLVTQGNINVLYSYSTPVAIGIDQGCLPSPSKAPWVRAYRTEKKHSVTTSKHINKFLRWGGVEPHEAAELPQEVLDDWENREFAEE